MFSRYRAGQSRDVVAVDGEDDYETNSPPILHYIHFPVKIKKSIYAMGNCILILKNNLTLSLDDESTYLKITVFQYTWSYPNMLAHVRQQHTNVEK